MRLRLVASLFTNMSNVPVSNGLNDLSPCKGKMEGKVKGSKAIRHMCN